MNRIIEPKAYLYQTPLETRGNYQAWLNLFFGLGSAGGAAFGGFLCEKIGWRWVRVLSIPFPQAF
jgi:MFS family permease